MNYEIDFLGFKQGKQDADAICLRYFEDPRDKPVVVVYDGGFKCHGEDLINHLNKYYFNETSNPVIDYVICSHPDQDHASGLSELLTHFRVNTLIMNRPWSYIDELFPKIDDGRITKLSLDKRLRENYPYINELEEIATKTGTQILEGFQGNIIDNRLTILSPSKEFYLQLLIESSKTPLQADKNSLSAFLKKTLRNIFESWENELIREDVETSAENESSIIILGDMKEEKFLLTGDAGIRGLKVAADYSDKNNIKLKEVKIHQIPHHGGRHNVSPSVLNRILGNITEESDAATKTAIVSVAVDSDHPKKMVTNAYIRRGANVYQTRGITLHWHHGNIPIREGWGSVSPLRFSQEVEDWRD